LLRSVSEVAIAFFDLLDAEAGALRCGLLRLSLGLALVVVAAGTVVFAMASLLWAIFTVLGHSLSSPGAAMLTALAAAILSVLLALAAWRIAR
jgi:hypothetical protein